MPRRAALAGGSHPSRDEPGVRGARRGCCWVRGRGASPARTHPAARPARGAVGPTGRSASITKRLDHRDLVRPHTARLTRLRTAVVAMESHERWPLVGAPAPRNGGEGTPKGPGVGVPAASASTRRPAFILTVSVVALTTTDALRARRRSSRCVGTCVPTSTETPTERGSVTRCDGHGGNRGFRSGWRASPGGRPGASLPRVRGPLDQADRRPSRSLAGDGQGVLLRPVLA